ncbi:MAG: GNAT family N-acetyltransferase [Pseudanabaena sp.]|nr:MAG: GNAT family N-acetyltransferase [Pseudanabaena sp.]
MSLPPVLHQGRTISLRRTAPVDAELLYERMYKNAEFMHLFRLNTFYDSLSRLRESLAQKLETPPEQTGYLEMLIIHKIYGPIGLTYLADFSPVHRRAEFAVGLFDPNHRQASYALESGLLVGDLSFNRYNIQRLYTYVYGYNDFSQKTTIAAGFALEGIARKHIFDESSKDFVDLYHFGMILEDFRNNQRLARFSQRLVGRDITQPLRDSIPEPIRPPIDHPEFIQSGQIRISF